MPDGISRDWFAIGDGYPATVELPALLLYAPVAPDRESRSENSGSNTR